MSPRPPSAYQSKGAFGVGVGVGLGVGVGEFGGGAIGTI